MTDLSPQRPDVPSSIARPALKARYDTLQDALGDAMKKKEKVDRVLQRYGMKEWKIPYGGNRGK